MAGVAGRSGGHNRKPLESHVLSGTYRRDRHGDIPERGNLAVLPAAHTVRHDPDDRESRRLLTGLSRSAKALGRRLLDEFEGWGPSDLLVLRLALEALDRDEECRRRIATEGLTLTGKRGGMRPHPLIRVERAAAAFALAAFKQLGLGGRS